MGKNASSGSKLLGQFLRQLRGSRSLQSIEDLSKSPPLQGRIRPVDVSTLSKIETGKQYPSLTTLLSLEEIYEVPIQRFLDHVKLEKCWDLRPATGDYDTAMGEGYKALETGDHQQAYAAFLLAEDVAAEHEKKAVAAHNRAITLWKMGMHQESIFELNELLSDLSLPLQLQLKALTNLSAVHREHGNLFEARLHAQEGLRLAESGDIRRSQAFLHRILGTVNDDLHERAINPDDRVLREALRHYEKSATLFTELELPGETAISRVNIGSAYCRLGNFIVGLKALKEGLAECEHDGNRWNVAFAQKELGRAYFLSRNHQRAKDYLYDCERIAERMGYVDLLFICYFYLREIEVASGGAGHHEYRRLLRLRPLQEGKFFELQQFEKQLELRKENVG
jgi:tetratricopeptide (TPR) repeat protein